MKLAILSNAGGSGKTTLSAHLAYLLGKKGISVCLIDLDPQGSLNLFCGQPTPEPEKSLAKVLHDDFQGNYPLINIWSDHTKNVQLLSGGLALSQSANDIAKHLRGAYLLSDRLQDYPLLHQVIIFDCPATLSILPTLALAACTHILVPIQLQPKAIDGSAKLWEWIEEIQKTLRLKPEPSILGVVPGQYNKSLAIERMFLESLPQKLKALAIECLPAIRFSAEIVNASAFGQPLHLYRPGHPACADFNPVTDLIIKTLNKKKNGKKI